MTYKDLPGGYVMITCHFCAAGTPTPNLTIPSMATNQTVITSKADNKTVVKKQTGEISSQEPMTTVSTTQLERVNLTNENMQ